MMNTTNANQINTSWGLARASVDSLAKDIESGRTDALFIYLQTMAKFPTFSARNILLIAAARPDATHLEGFRAWNEFGRSVRPGEKGIRIFAPTVGVKPNSQAQPQDASKKLKSSAIIKVICYSAVFPEKLWSPHVEMG